MSGALVRISVVIHCFLGSHLNSTTPVYYVRDRDDWHNAKLSIEIIIVDVIPLHQVQTCYPSVVSLNSVTCCLRSLLLYIFLLLFQIILLLFFYWLNVDWFLLLVRGNATYKVYASRCEELWLNTVSTWDEIFVIWYFSNGHHLNCSKVFKINIFILDVLQIYLLCVRCYPNPGPFPTALPSSISDLVFAVLVFNLDKNIEWTWYCN